MARINDDPAPTEALPKQAQKDLGALLSSMKVLKPEHVKAKLFWYGDPGTGKTTQAMRFAQAVRKPDEWILYIDTAQGWTSLMNEPALMQNVRRVRFENMESLRLFAQYMRDPNPKVQEIFAPFSSVVFDEFTNMADRDLHWIVRSRAAQAEKKGEFKDPHNPAMPDYLSQNVRAMEVVNDFMDLEKNVFFIGHSRYEKETGKIGIDLPNKLAKSIVQLMHGLYYATTVENGDSVGFANQLNERVKAKPPRQAKNRIGGLEGSFATTEQMIEAYKKWGIVSEVDTAISVGEDDKTAQPVANDKPETVNTDNLDSLLS